MNRLLFVFFFVYMLSLSACDPKPRETDSERYSADSVTVDSVASLLDSAMVDSVAMAKAADRKDDLWDPHLFDSIPKYSQERAFKMDPYPEIIKRYERDDFVYSENIKDKISVLQRILQRISEWLGDIMPDNPYKFNKEFGYVFAFLALIALAFMLYKILYNKNQYFIKHEYEADALDTLAYVERNLMNSDLSQYIRDAVAQKNYALGIRYLQLLNIQKLAQAGYIKWKHSKTNAEFANELQDKDLRVGFEECTRVFDYVWFGQFELKESDFSHYEQLFNQYQNQIK
ncbi:DUF4129 domain-containing protein [Sphingobacterium puteale]|uniref:DUF4129 domain-containing protein n=1 Tax=Sphingobacterium puteale TaxID=2420510 RepID=UPI003D951054